MCQYFADNRLLMYDLLNLLGAVFLFMFNLKQIKHKKLFLGGFSKYFIEKKKTHLEKTNYEIKYAYIEVIIFSIFQYAFAGNLNLLFGRMVNTSYNYFGLLYFSPVILTVVSLFLAVNIFKQMDLMTPSFPLALIFAKLGCFFNGCCRGFECEWGLINYKDESNLVREFPSQLLEAGLALVIFFFLVWYRKKAKEGTMFPIYTILYSATRFFSEFTRREPNVFGILKKYHILCLIGIVIGLIELLLATKYKDSITAACSRISKALNQRMYNYALKNRIIKEKNIIHHKKKK